MFYVCSYKVVGGPGGSIPIEREYQSSVTKNPRKNGVFSRSGTLRPWRYVRNVNRVSKTRKIKKKGIFSNLLSYVFRVF